MPGSNISGTVGFFTDKPSVIDTANASADKLIAIKIISNKPTQSASFVLPLYLRIKNRLTHTLTVPSLLHICSITVRLLFFIEKEPLMPIAVCVPTGNQ